VSATRHPVAWPNVAFLVGTPILAIGGAAWYTAAVGIFWEDLALCAVMYMATGLAITAGYHRYYSHRTYECARPVRIWWLLFGAAAVENSALCWSSDHRDHHRFVDSEKDPYDIMKGIFWAHMGWIFFRDLRTEAERFANAPDLRADPLVRWQHRWYLAIAIGVSLGVPALAGLLTGRIWGAILWGGVIRLVLCHHGTFLINSAAHAIGRQPYSDADTSRDNPFLALFTFGEGYHNFHHAFPGDYRNGVRWFHWDPSKWVLLALRAAGLAWRLNRMPDRAIARAKMEMDRRRAERLLARRPDVGGATLVGRLAAGRARLDAALTRMSDLAGRHARWARGADAVSAAARDRLRAAWERKLRRAAIAVRLARDRYALARRDLVTAGFEAA
jgi:stearoyl-CoA desaturase (delta-9 desaturase)